MAEETEELPEETLNGEQEEFITYQEQIDGLALRAEIAEAIAEKLKSRAEELDRLNTRLQGDFDNHRKRTAEQAKKLKEDGAAEVIEKMVPLVDTLERAIAMMRDESTAEGLKMVLKQYLGVLADFGVTEIPALGEPFDPALHNAVASGAVKKQKQVNTVVEVFQKGYRIGERILRHSMVKVGV